MAHSASPANLRQNPADSGGTGSSLADELLSLPQNATISSLLNVGDRQHVPSVFVQDDFKVNDRLTLNLGLRYEYVSPLVDVHDQQSNFDYQTGQIVVAGRNGASRGLVDVDHLNFAPSDWICLDSVQRRPHGIRSAYGIFYSGQEIRTAAPLTTCLQRSVLLPADIHQ